jgi:hypothetical protein
MKDIPRQQFRWAPHVAGAANVKPRDYEASGEVDAENEYAAWALLRDSNAPLLLGDVLELPSGQLRVCKYVGFEEARWFVPELRIPDSPVATSDVAQNEIEPERVSAQN